MHGKGDKVRLRILSPTHLLKHDARLLSITTDVVNLPKRRVDKEDKEE